MRHIEVFDGVLISVIFDSVATFHATETNTNLSYAEDTPAGPPWIRRGLEYINQYSLSNQFWSKLYSILFDVSQFNFRFYTV